MLSNVKNMEVKTKKQFYFREVQQELKKITWTPKKELWGSTKTVLVSAVLFGFVIYAADVVIHSFFNSINNIVRLIIG